MSVGQGARTLEDGCRRRGALCRGGAVQRVTGGCRVELPEGHADTDQSTLGVVVPAPTEVRNGRVFECMFGQPGTTTRALVTVDFQTDVSPTKLKAMRSVFGGHSTTTFSGLGLPAFSSVQGTGSARNNGLVVLKGRTAVEVFWGGPLAKIAALVKKILPTV